jgi:hypothetical protein
MSSPFSSEHFARIRHDARGMVERTRDHEGRLNALVQTAEGVARHATVLSEALARIDVDGHEIEHLCVEQVRRSAENAQRTVRAYVSAREQHAAAHRNWTRLDDGSADANERTGSAGTAVLVVDQSTALITQATTRAYLLETGRLRTTGPTPELLADDHVRESYLGIAV